MRILFVHPDDSPRRGPWTRERWDLVVDMARSSAHLTGIWSEQYRCRVLSADVFRGGVDDFRRVRQMFATGKNQLLDEEGIDWWDLSSLLVAFEAHEVLAMQRLAQEIKSSAELWSTRPGGSARIVAHLIHGELHAFGSGRAERFAKRAGYYRQFIQKFSPPQIRQIFLDKYDSDYRWRSRFAHRPAPQSKPVVLIPSAYVNVSRTAAAYARLLPEQRFLLVATRDSAKEFKASENIEVRDLAAYVPSEFPSPEIVSLQQRWGKVKSCIDEVPELRTLAELGQFDAVPRLIRDGMIARDAWREVLEGEPVVGVLCGDDSNRYTRIPVLLAAKRNITTVDFHHGAFDGRYLVKDLPSDIYLAKNVAERDYLVRVCGLAEERIAIGAPVAVDAAAPTEGDERNWNSVVFFSEPYEICGVRGEEVYQELLPHLCRVARENRREVVVKLHPAESLTERRRMIRQMLPRNDYERIRVVDGPLTDDLLSRAWFGITVGSTTVMDCMQRGVPCFLCGWLTLIPCGYSEQYERFGIGQSLPTVDQVGSIPQRLAGGGGRPDPKSMRSYSIDPAKLRGWLTSQLNESVEARPA